MEDLPKKRVKKSDEGRKSSKQKEIPPVETQERPVNPIVKDICQAIADKKGFNVVVLDVRDVSTMTDYFIIAEGNVDRHVIALAQHVQDVLREKGQKPIHAEGEREGNWVVLDYLDFMVHFFVPELREHYSLEEVWKEGKIVNFPIEYERKTAASEY